MEFNQIISEKLHTLFTENGLAITEQSKNTIRYESALLRVSLVQDLRSNSNSLWIGRKYSSDIEIDNHLMEAHFNSDLKLSNLPQETFANNALQFFLGDGKKLLEGKGPALIRLEKFNEQRSFEYTANLIERQNLEAAISAWKDENYLDVIRYLDKVNKANLPESFKQKYRIAQQRLKS